MISLPTLAARLGLLCAGALLLTQPVFAATDTWPALDAPLPTISGTEWRWAVAGEGPISLHGAINRDKAGGETQAMLYPAFNPLSFVAAVLTHAAINSGIRSAEQEKQLKDADLVLQPLSSAMENLTVQRITTGVAQHSELLAEHQMNPASPPEWLVEITPSFVLAQDLRLLTLDAQILVWPAAKGKVPVAMRKIRVLSDPLNQDGISSYWADNNGAALQRIGSGLLAEAIELAVQSWPTADASLQRTLKFRDGTVVRAERAQLLGTACGRLHARNLRGWLLSVPASEVIAGEDKTPSCDVVAARFH